MLSCKMNTTILGCGRWASFHAWYQASILKNKTLMWGRKNDGLFRTLSETRKNEYLELPKSVKFTNDLNKALNHAEYIIIAISAQAMPSFSKTIAEHNPKNKTFVLCMKGLIDETGERLSEVLSKEIDPSNKIVVWVGPGHTQELSKGQPNIMIIGGSCEETVADVATKFRSNLIRLYQSDDIIGCEIGAAAKNVHGILAGILDGSGLSSLKGALMARGVYEVSLLISTMGGQKLTAYGISHIGDFEATLFSKNSNNRKFGEEFVKNPGKKFEYLAEGVATCKAIKVLADKYNVEMPLCNFCYQTLHKGKDLTEGLKEFFDRDNAKEFRF